MQSHTKKQNDINRIIQAVLTKKWLVLSCILGALAPILYYNQTTLPVYEATATILCMEDRGSMPIGYDIAQARLGYNFVENQLHQIRSWSLLNNVVDNLPEDILAVLPQPTSNLNDYERIEFFANVLSKNISANQVPNSDVIRISAQANSSEAACVIANSIAVTLKNINLDFHREEIRDIGNKIEEQINKFQVKVEESARNLENYKNQNEISFLNEEAQELFRRTTEAETEYNRVTTELKAAQKQLSFLKRKVSKERKDLVPNITTITSPRAQQLKNALIELEVKLTNLKIQGYKENHPQVVKIKSQIENVKEGLKKETLKIANGENIIDPLSQIQRDLENIANLEVQIYTHRAHAKALKDILNAYNKKLKDLPHHELKLGDLIREKEINDNIYTMLLQKREESKIKEAEKTGNIRIIDPARIPKNPIKPKKFLNLVIGLILGCSIGVGLAVLLESFNTSIKTTEEVEQYLELPVFTTIPHIKSSNNGRLTYKQKDRKLEQGIPIKDSMLITSFDPLSPEVEAFRALRTNIQFVADSSSMKTMLITSATPSEGKSLIAANLAITSAQMGMKTLLIDFDLRKPMQHSLFGKDQIPGIMDFIKSKNLEINESKMTIEKIIQTISLDIGELHLITAGTLPNNPSMVLESKLLKSILDLLSKDYSVILLDTPPILTVSDAAILGKDVDRTILVIRAGKNRHKEILRSKELLQRAKCNLIGTVLNDVNKKSHYYSHYQYNKYYNKNNKI